MILPARELPMPMSPPERISLAVGLFDRLVAIDSALRDVVASGFAKSANAILVSLHSHEFARLGTVLRVPLLDVPVLRCDSADTQIGTDWLGDTFCGLDANCRHADRGGCGLLHQPDGAALKALERQSNRLHGHLARGGAVLVVRLDTMAEQQAICSMLLHYASDGVITHQVRTAAARRLPAFLAQKH